MSDLLHASARSESSLRERLEGASLEGDLKARLASTRSELEAVTLERDALVRERERERKRAPLRLLRTRARLHTAAKTLSRPAV